jgi:hypothetical protein
MFAIPSIQPIHPGGERCLKLAGSLAESEKCILSRTHMNQMK